MITYYIYDFNKLELFVLFNIKTWLWLHFWFNYTFNVFKATIQFFIFYICLLVWIFIKRSQYDLFWLTEY